MKHELHNEDITHAHGKAPRHISLLLDDFLKELRPAGTLRLASSHKPAQSTEDTEWPWAA
jgi:hypothetical protein